MDDFTEGTGISVCVGDCCCEWAGHGGYESPWRGTRGPDLAMNERTLLLLFVSLYVNDSGTSE